MELTYEINIDQLVAGLNATKEEMEKDIREQFGNLALMTHTKTLELANSALGGGSLSDKYAENLDWEQVDENFSIVTLNKPALWIEEGVKAGFMEWLLNGKSSKTSKDGKRYAVIPFKHAQSTDGVDTTPKPSRSARQMATDIKRALGDKGVDWKKIELGPDGSPRTGRLHTFNLDTARSKNPTTGAKHKSAMKSAVSVYQTKDKQGKVKRDIVTFRIIHEDHKNEGLWHHPGRQPGKFMDLALAETVDIWENQILPQILDKHTG